MHAVDADFFEIFDFLEVLWFLVEIVVDER